MKKITAIISISFFFICAHSYAEAGEAPERIVSLSPGITEILYKLGLGDKVVGVTDFCNFPEDAKAKPRVGGYLDINYEAIIRLEPDFVIMTDDYSDDIKEALKKAGIGYLAVKLLTVDDILSAVREIGEYCGARQKAAEAASEIRASIDAIRKNAPHRPSSRVMIVVGRDRGSFDNIYIAGRNTFYDELLGILGCENVYTGDDIVYPSVSIEGIMRLDPDIIIEMLPDCPADEIPKITGEWRLLKDVKAVKNNKVYVFNEDYVCIPGPRFVLILKKMEELL